MDFGRRYRVKWGTEDRGCDLHSLASRVDHVVEELKKVGLDVAFDRAHIIPGQRPWPQIDQGNIRPLRTDGRYWQLLIVLAASYASRNLLTLSTEHSEREVETFP